MSKAEGVGSKSVTELLVAIPVLHVLATSLFLIGYYYAFGGRLHSFSVSSDLFATSIGSVGFNYISTLSPGIVFVLWHRANWGAWTLQESVEAKPEGQERDVAYQRAMSDKRFFLLMIGLIIVGQVVVVAISYFKFGYIPYNSVGFFAAVVIVVYVVWYSGKVNIPSLTMHTINFILIMLSTCLFNGMASGQVDKRLQFNEAKNQAVVCALGAVLRPVGNHFLILTPKNEHVIGDKDCKLVGKLART